MVTSEKSRKSMMLKTGSGEWQYQEKTILALCSLPRLSVVDIPLLSSPRLRHLTALMQRKQGADTKDKK